MCIIRGVWEGWGRPEECGRDDERGRDGGGMWEGCHVGGVHGGDVGGVW